MNKTIIENTIKFLQRTELKGNEVPAFNECSRFLELIISGDLEIKPKEKEEQTIIE